LKAIREGKGQGSVLRNFSIDKPVDYVRKYFMRIIARKPLLEFSARFPDAKGPLERWWTTCKRNNFSNFAELKKTFGSADMVGRCVIFNVGGGKYRLVARVNFKAFTMWIKYILPHEQYDRLDLKEDSKCRP